VEHSAPKYPDALALDIEEGNGLEPPDVRPCGEVVQPWHDKFDEATRRGLDCEWLRQYVVRGGLWRTKELAEEAALGQQLMAQDLTNVT